MSAQVPLYSSQVCPRCHQSFECKATDIGKCQCNSIYLSKEQTTFINQQYAACLCINCLTVLQQAYEQQISTQTK